MSEINIEFLSGRPEKPITVVPGVFDGVHLGHRRLLDFASKMACEAGTQLVALTFMPHPREVLTPQSAPPLLMPPAERFALLRSIGIDQVAVAEFTAETAALSPEDFLQALQRQFPAGIACICASPRWRFGRAGAGDSAVLTALCERRHIACRILPELLSMDGEVVSSSQIRNLVSNGDLDGAAARLGDWPAVYGTVIHGAGVAGPVLSAPTANLRLEYGVPVPNGVYIAQVSWEGSFAPALVNIGVAPTFDGDNTRKIEVHIPDFAGTLYGKKLIVRWRRFLRPEQRFATPGELKKQIEIDLRQFRSQFQNFCRQP